MLSPKVLSFVAVLVVATVNGAQPPQTNCNQQAFLHNSAALETALHLAQGTLWSDPVALQRYLNKLLYTEPGLNEVTTHCNAFNNFYAGLGKENIRFCLGPLGFIKQGKSPEQAWGFDGVLRQNRFQCGAGYYIAQYRQKQMLTCIQSTIKNNIDKIQNLTISYLSNVEHDPLNACNKYVKTLQTSFAQIFAKGPCAKVDAQLAAFWACEGQSQYISAQFPHCVYTNRCDYDNVLHFTEELVRVQTNGELSVFIPPTMKKNAQGELFEEPGKWI
uniref:Secreted protein n=1 Tax=Steinernema glaseri TaxID=37863 RepID=A0A1I8A1H8_9BILA